MNEGSEASRRKLPLHVCGNLTDKVNCFMLYRVLVKHDAKVHKKPTPNTTNFKNLPTPHVNNDTLKHLQKQGIWSYEQCCNTNTDPRPNKQAGRSVSCAAACMREGGARPLAAKPQGRGGRSPTRMIRQLRGGCLARVGAGRKEAARAEPWHHVRRRRRAEGVARGRPSRGRGGG